METSSFKKGGLVLVVMALMLAFLPCFSASAATMGERLKGKILLQVEKSGEAWYVNPANQKRYFMGRPEDAFSLMRELGIGISNADILKIQVADANFTGKDTDGDGLSDMIEDSFGTDKDKADTDDDGTGDKEELLAGTNPLGEGSWVKDVSFGAKLAGKILLQVEKNGEAWYINPADSKRYFLGRPADAFSVMRGQGLGVKNVDIEKVTPSLKDKYTFKGSKGEHNWIDGEIVINPDLKTYGMKFHMSSLSDKTVWEDFTAVSKTHTMSGLNFGNILMKAFDKEIATAEYDNMKASEAGTTSTSAAYHQNAYMKAITDALGKAAPEFVKTVDLIKAHDLDISALDYMVYFVFVDKPYHEVDYQYDESKDELLFKVQNVEKEEWAQDSLTKQEFIYGKK